MKTYDAFISYAHSDCSPIAERIQKHVENLGKPWYQLKRNQSIFRDETNLTVTPELWASIQEAIGNSDNIILLATPSSAQSNWVQSEINEWYVNHAELRNQDKNVYIVLLEGDISWDAQTNDFNWDKTTALSQEVFSKKFNSEPFWIDLKPYVSRKENQIVLNKESRRGFVLKLTKIVAGLLKKEPREIESDELRRSRRIRSVISVAAIFFVGLMITSFFVNKQSRFERKASRSNSLIARGNYYSQKNISDALYYYYYAYILNPNDANFKILNDFYRQNLAGENRDINLYFKEQGGQYNELLNTNKSNWTFYANDMFCCVKSDTIEILNLTTLEVDKQVLDFSTYFAIASLPDKDEIYLMKSQWSDTTNPFLLKYNLRSKKKSILEVNVPEEYVESKVFYSWTCNLSRNGERLVIFPAGTFPTDNGPFDLPIFALNLSTLEMKEHQFELDSYGNDEVKDCQIQNSGQHVYFKHGTTYEGADLRNVNYIYNLDTDTLVKKISNGEDGLAWYLDELKAFSWGVGDYFYIGKNGGEIMSFGAEEFVAEISSFPNGELPSSKITSIWVDRDYVITGTIKGVVTFWTNSFEDEELDFGMPWFDDRYGSVRLPAIGENLSGAYDSLTIDQLYFNRARNVLIATNYNGNVYSIDISKVLTLSKDPETLKNQIKSLNINDLSEEVKKRYKLNDL